jgi:hypothetical protein
LWERCVLFVLAGSWMELEIQFLDEREEYYREWCEYLAEIEHSDANNVSHHESISLCCNLITHLTDENKFYFLHTSNVTIEIPNVASQLAEKYSNVLSDYHFLLQDYSIALYKSNARNISYHVSALFFLTSVLGNSISDEIKDDLDTFFNHLKSQNLLLSTLAARLATLMAIQDKSFVDSLAGDTDIIQIFIDRLVICHRYMTEMVKNSDDLEFEIFSKIFTTPLPHPPLSEANRNHPLFHFSELPSSLNSMDQWSISQLEWLACTSLSLLSCVADVLDLLGSLLTHNIIQITIDLMKMASIKRINTHTISGEPNETCFFPTLLLSGGHFLEKAFAHRKLSLDFIDSSGLELFSHLYSIPCASHLEVVLTSCLYTLVSHTQVMEKIIRRKKDELKMIYQLAISYLMNSLTFSTRENVVAIFSVILPYRPSYFLFHSFDVLRLLFQMMRVCLFTKPESNTDGIEDDDEDDDHIESEDHNDLSGSHSASQSQSHPFVTSTSSLEATFSSFIHLPVGNAIPEHSVELMYRCVKDIGADQLNELRDDILRVLLIYLRVGALLDLELSSPESLSPMCGGTSNQWVASNQSKLVGSIDEFTASSSSGPSGTLLTRRSHSSTSQTAESNPNENMNSSINASQYTVITFDGEDSCAGSAEALLHAMREFVSNFNDLIRNPNHSRYPLEVHSSPTFLSRRDLLWCTPVKLPSQPITRKDSIGSSSRKMEHDLDSVSYASPIKDLLKNGSYLPLILYILQTESSILHGNSNTMIYILQILELLCLNPTVIEQMCTTLVMFMTISGNRETPIPQNSASNLTEEELCDEMESINGLSLVLDIACRGPKRFVCLNSPSTPPSISSSRLPGTLLSKLTPYTS